jgi:hypothetical protein
LTTTHHATNEGIIYEKYARRDLNDGAGIRFVSHFGDKHRRKKENNERHKTQERNKIMLIAKERKIKPQIRTDKTPESKLCHKRLMPDGGRRHRCFVDDEARTGEFPPKIENAGGPLEFDVTLGAVIQNGDKESSTNQTIGSTVQSDAHRRKRGKNSLAGKIVDSIRISGPTFSGQRAPWSG